MNDVVSLPFEGNLTTNSKNNESEENAPTTNCHSCPWRPSCRHDSNISVPGMDLDTNSKGEISKEVIINYTQPADSTKTYICHEAQRNKEEHSVCSIQKRIQEQALCKQIFHRGTVRVVDGLEWKNDLLYKNSTEFIHLKDVFTELVSTVFELY